MGITEVKVWLVEGIVYNWTKLYRDRLDPGISICVGERHYPRYGIRPLLEGAICGIIMPDITRCGRPSELKRMATMAETYGVQVAPPNPNGPLSKPASSYAGFTTGTTIFVDGGRSAVMQD